MVASADAQALAKEGKFLLRDLRATAACFGRGLLAQFRTAPHSIIPKHFSSTRAGGVSRVHDVHSSKMSWWKMVRASAPPWERTPSCRDAVVRAAIRPSLSAKSRRGTHFRTNSFWMGRTFLGSISCWLCVMRAWEMSAVSACASVRDRIHSSSSNIFCCWVFFFLQKT